MKNFLLLCLLLCTVYPAVAQAPASSSATTARKKRIAVLDFDYGTVHSASNALFGTDVDVGKGITNLLITKLVQDGTYSIIERQALDKIMAEQNFSNSDRANPTSAAKIGKLLGVDAIIVGSITQFGSDTANKGVGGGGGNFHGFGFGGFHHSNTKAIVSIDARLVDIDTAEILGVAEGVGQSSRSSTSLLGGGGNWGGFGGGNADFGNSNFQQTIIGEAVKNAVDQLTTGIVSDNTKLQARTITVSGLVASVDGGEIVLNVGTKDGLKVGDQMKVERVTRQIKDPATGQVIRRMTTPVGVIEITDADAGSSVAKVVSGAGLRVGDMVKTATQ